MKSRRGMTLVEAMLAGAIAAFAVLALMEGLVVIAKISNENSRLLAAEAYAWDTAWQWLNMPWDSLNGSTAWQWYPNVEGYTISDSDCHEINAWPGSEPKCYVRVRTLPGSQNPRHGVTQYVAKIIEVDVEWGPSGDRKRLNAFGGTATPSYHIPVSVVKGPIERGR